MIDILIASGRNLSVVRAPAVKNFRPTGRADKGGSAEKFLISEEDAGNVFSRER